jgi:(S)-2-hydroxyglutarate dehydrogenase
VTTENGPTTARIGVIGAGIVGLAVARRLLQATAVEVTVIDKESTVAAHQTSHNSNVVHSGVYYPPGSLKSTLCRRGGALIRAYCAERQLPYEVLGKVIVALREDELPHLSELANRAKANGIAGSRVIDAAELRDREPHVRGLSALLVPETAVVDFRRIAEELAADVVRSGGEVILGHPVREIHDERNAVRVETDVDERIFDHLVVCAGLQSSQVARMVGAPSDPEIIPFRGEYYEIAPERTSLVRGLVYPVPDPRYPFLGVHFTRGLDGNVHVGPNAVLALSQEGYGWSDIRVRDLWRTARYPGMHKMARQHWRMGAREVCGSVSSSVFLRRARAYVPDLNRTDLVRSGTGVRAQALSRDGRLVDDFVIDHQPRLTLVRNAPSPAATASLAIAEHIVGEMADNDESFAGRIR